MIETSSYHFDIGLWPLPCVHISFVLARMLSMFPMLCEMLTPCPVMCVKTLLCACLLSDVCGTYSKSSYFTTTWSLFTQKCVLKYFLAFITSVYLTEKNSPGRTNPKKWVKHSYYTPLALKITLFCNVIRLTLQPNIKKINHGCRLYFKLLIF